MLIFQDLTPPTNDQMGRAADVTSEAAGADADACPHCLQKRQDT